MATPFWVNLTLIIPFILWYSFKKGLKLSKQELISAGIFAFAFGMTEAIVVIYLRTIGQSDIQTQALNALSSKIQGFEQIREFCTLVMLGAISFLGAKSSKERLALFFYSFSIWDIIYYFGLKIFIGWPPLFTTQDVLFLIPTPWQSQVWFPILICLAIIGIVIKKSNFKTGAK